MQRTEKHSTFQVESGTMTVSFTMLNAMASRDFETALDRHVSWGLRHLDLKDSVFGKAVADLTEEESARAKRMIDDRGLNVYCLSTTLFDADIESGEAAFRAEQLGPLDRAIAVAKHLRPDLVRLLAARTGRRGGVGESVTYLEETHPWVMGCYREAVERIADAGFRVTIENECHDCIFATPEEILAFFERLHCGEAVNLTWDVQNLWQMGTFPDLRVYEQLKPILAYYHLKGGQSGADSRALRWKSCLQDASWPVEAITRQVIADGLSPVICLNGSHGERKPGYDYENSVERDLDYVRRTFGGAA